MWPETVLMQDEVLCLILRFVNRPLSALSHFVSLFLQEKFGADQTVVELAGLLPATDYSVTLYALYDEDPSDPVTAVATTCKTNILVPYFSLFPSPFLSIIFLSLSSFILLHHFLIPSYSLFLPLFLLFISYRSPFLSVPSSFSTINISGAATSQWH